MKLRIAIAVALTLALGAGVMFWTSRDSGESVAGPTGEGKSWTGASRTVEVFLDGWSLAALGSQQPVWSDDAEHGGPVTFTAVDAGDLQNLLAATPEVVTRALARMVTPDVSLNCDPNGCRTEGGDIELSWLLDPSTAPAFGEVHSAWGVTAGLYRAEVRVPGESQKIYIGTREWKPATLSATSTPGSTRATTGYGRELYLLAAGAGSVFHNDPQWVGATEPISYLPGAASNQHSSDAAKPFLDGLVLGGTVGDTLNAQILNNGMATWVTSPTVGCAGQLVCVPEQGLAKVSRVQIVSTEVANTEGQKGTVVWQTYVLEWDSPKPTHIRMVWNGQGPQFPSADKMRAVGFNGYPPLITGKQKIRVSVAILLSGQEGSTPIHLAFSTAQSGFSGAEFDQSIGPAELNRMFSGAWSPVR
jgi:hypothetical protein